MKLPTFPIPQSSEIDFCVRLTSSPTPSFDFASSESCPVLFHRLEILLLATHPMRRLIQEANKSAKAQSKNPKVFVEKVLRVQADVKQLYLLVRAEDEVEAAHRFQKEVIGKDVSRILRERRGKSFESFVSEKVTPFAGNLCYENLGVKDSILREEMWREVQIVIIVAATTAFDERYDVALGINTTGAKRVLEFAKKCPKIEMLMQVSTAYVNCGWRSICHCLAFL
ncbi:hypothetical protein H6P81_016723 [Aristolochia fimbriata]|uniref:Fatty acyl-CoA reductase n=1 Tax=Aristolochia fimbriata TaxID=158543 RepID=A0AAV7EDR4_ARIFI|nr:hypothetical protein H6P81_016723 [Aristolochia fimbriata]